MAVQVATNPRAKLNQFRIPPALAMKNVRPTSPNKVMPSAPSQVPAAAVRDFGNIATAGAMQNADDPDSPFSAFAQGWINAIAEREILEAAVAEKNAAEAEAKAIRDTTAEMLAGHPDLQRLVQINGLKPEQAVKRKEQREQAAAALNEVNEEQAHIIGYLEENYPEFVEPFASGLWDINMVAENISKNYGIADTDYGDLGKGRAWLRNQDGSIKTDEQGLPIAAPFQGGEVWDEKQNFTGKDAPANFKAGIVVEDIDRALTNITGNSTMTTGIGAQATGWIPGSAGYDTNSLIDTVKANAGFAELQAMREASPTGGALGSVTEKEIAYLQATIGNHDTKQGAPQLTDNHVKNAYLDIIHGPARGPPRERLGFESPGPVTSAPAVLPQAAPVTATNSETGEKMQWDGQKWVPVQ